MQRCSALAWQRGWKSCLSELGSENRKDVLTLVNTTKLGYSIIEWLIIETKSKWFQPMQSVIDLSSVFNNINAVFKPNCIWKVEIHSACPNLNKRFDKNLARVCKEEVEERSSHLAQRRGIKFSGPVQLKAHHALCWEIHSFVWSNHLSFRFSHFTLVSTTQLTAPSMDRSKESIFEFYYFKISTAAWKAEFLKRKKVWHSFTAIL